MLPPTQPIGREAGGGGGGHIDFDMDPLDGCFGVGIGVGVGVSITLSFLHIILWTSGWIHTKFSWIYNSVITKSLFDFDLLLDLIFKDKNLKPKSKEWSIWNFITFTRIHQGE